MSSRVASTVEQYLASLPADRRAASGKKLDMGKACVRFKTLDALPLDIIGEAISRVPVDAYVAAYEASREKSVKPRPIGERAVAKRSASKARATATRATRGAAKPRSSRR